jgi:hypothetical protein
VHLLVLPPIYCSILYSPECYTDAFLWQLNQNDVRLLQLYDNWQPFNYCTRPFSALLYFQKHIVCTILPNYLLIGLHMTGYGIWYPHKCVCNCNHNYHSKCNIFAHTYANDLKFCMHTWDSQISQLHVPPECPHVFHVSPITMHEYSLNMRMQLCQCTLLHPRWVIH